MDPELDIDPVSLLDEDPPGWREWVAGLAEPAPAHVPEPAPVMPAPEPTAVTPAPAVDGSVPVENPLPELGVDALSGGAMPEPEPEPEGFRQFMEGGPPPPQAPEPFSLEQTEAAMAPSPVPEQMWQPEAIAAEEDRLLGLSPEQFAAEQARDAAEREQHTAGLWSDAMAEADRRQSDIDSARSKALASTVRRLTDARERIEELSQRDPDDFFSGEMNGRKALGWVRAILTGLVSPLHGLAVLNQEMERNLELQQQAIGTEVAGLKESSGLLLEEYGKTGDMLEGKERVLLAWKQRLPALIAAEAAKYDPLGSAARAAASAVRKAQADAAAAQIEYEDKLRKQAIEEAELGIKLEGQQLNVRKQVEQERSNRKSESLQGYGIAQTARTAQAGRDAEMLKLGMVPDASVPGGYRVDDELAKKIRSAKPQDEKAALELEQAKRADVVVDPNTQTPLGKPRDPKTAPDTRAKIEAYSNLRNELQTLYDLVASKPTEQKLIGRWKSETKSRIDTQREIVAATYAKIIDPIGAVSDKTIEAAKNVLPDSNGWTEKKNPRAVYETITKTADDKIETHAKEAIEGYAPGSLTKRYQDADKVMSAAAPKAAPVEQFIREVSAPPAPEEIATPQAREMYLRATKEKLSAIADRYKGDMGALYESVVTGITQSGKELSADEVNDLYREWDSLWGAAKARNESRQEGQIPSSFEDALERSRKAAR